MVGFSQLKISHSLIEQMFIEDVLCDRKLWYEGHMELVREDKTINKKRKEGERSSLHLLSKINTGILYES